MAPIFGISLDDLQKVRGYFAEEIIEPWESDQPSSKFFKMISSDKSDEKFSMVTGLGPMVKFLEGMNMIPDGPKQGYDKTLTYEQYGLYVEYTDMAFNDDQYGILKRTAEMLADSAQQTQTVSRASLVSLSFTSTTSPDGKYLCANDHTRPDGVATARSNILATPANLSVESVQQLLIDLASTKNGRGVQIGGSLKPVALSIPVALTMKGKEILNTVVGRPHIADNTANVIRDYNLELDINPYYTSDKAHWIICESVKGHRPLVQVTRKTLDTNVTVQEENLNRRFYAWIKFVTGAIDWVGLAGTPGV